MSEAPTNAEAVPIEREGQKKLSKNMVVNISLLCTVGAISIIALMFGDFEGKISRVVSTLMLFAAFTVFTAIEERKNRSALEMGIHQLGNVYMLGITLIQIWSTWGRNGVAPRDGDSFSGSYYYFDPFELFFNTLFLIGLSRVGVHLAQKAAALVTASQSQLALTAKLAMGSLILTTILFTLPISLHQFTDFGDLYWRFTISVLVFSCLMISIGLWMAWTFKQKMPWTSDRKNLQNTSSRLAERPFNEELGRDSRPVVEFVRAPSAVPAEHARVSTVKTDNSPTLPQFAAPVQNLTSWPVMPFGGQPLPKNADGRPDWDALALIVKTYSDAEKQFGPRS